MNIFELVIKNENMILLKIYKSFGYAIQGLQIGVKTQHMLRVQLLGFLTMNLTAYYFRFTKWEYLVCFILSALVLSAELMNTGIEFAVDLVTKEYHPLAEKAKDCAAGAVFLVSIAALIVWITIIVDKF